MGDRGNGIQAIRVVEVEEADNVINRPVTHDEIGGVDCKGGAIFEDKGSGTRGHGPGGGNGTAGKSVIQGRAGSAAIMVAIASRAPSFRTRFIALFSGPSWVGRGNRYLLASAGTMGLMGAERRIAKQLNVCDLHLLTAYENRSRG